MKLLGYSVCVGVCEQGVVLGLDKPCVNLSGWEIESIGGKTKSRHLHVLSSTVCSRTRCNPGQEAVLGVTVGVKAPLVY